MHVVDFVNHPLPALSIFFKIVKEKSGPFVAEQEFSAHLLKQIDCYLEMYNASISLTEDYRLRFRPAVVAIFIQPKKLLPSIKYPFIELTVQLNVRERLYRLLRSNSFRPRNEIWLPAFEYFTRII